ncbi:hypothetical protein P691DRAFT_417852 [Macrolepiota fuliginosa MF-IS2]|uniref:Uncharacterized protein n=1 Tax=Macrolepiota fuliginosa MF-IS2 TaxID=1400762 RepID=A0A9P5X3G0_9AGAR|nr:hypothetical protein P691DRAFT_417852 [Macrolepiota fuliginosa MF-IS2]
MTEAQYRSQVLNIAYDLRLARKLHRDDMGFWEDSGLATSAAHAKEIFDFVDEYITSAPIQDAAQAANEAYRLHGRLLNLLGHLHGDAPIHWPGMPEVTPWPNPESPSVSVPPGEGEVRVPNESSVARPHVGPSRFYGVRR